jgi:hypothetical protein
VRLGLNPNFLNDFGAQCSGFTSAVVWASPTRHGMRHGKSIIQGPIQSRSTVTGAMLHTTPVCVGSECENNAQN